MTAIPLQSYRALRGYALALGIYLVSRGLVLIAIFLAPQFIPVRVPPLPPASFWYDRLLQWDSGWYMSVIRDGYRYNGDPTIEQNVPFFPLYPLTSGAIGKIFALDVSLSMFVVSNVCALGAIVLLFKLVRDTYGEAHALPTIAFFSFFPGSLFLSSGYSEALTLLTVCAFFVLSRARQFMAAAIAAGLSSAVRPIGWVLVFPLMWELWTSYRRQPRMLAVAVSGYGLLSVSGLLLFMLYLWHSFGDPFAFARIQVAWTHSTGVLHDLFIALSLYPFHRLVTDVFVSGPMDVLNVWFCLIFLSMTAIFYRRLTIPHLIYAASVMLVPYVTRAGSPAAFLCMMRYALIAFPVFVLFAMVTQSKTWLRSAILGVFAAVLFILAASFSRGHPIV